MTRRRAITVGTFDGVHRGHAALIQAAKKALGDDTPVLVLAFDPHPLTALRPEPPPPRLSTLDQRRQWLAQCGADEIAILAPTPELLNQLPQQFLTELADRYAPGAIVEGPDFRFGRARAGSIQTLREHEQRLDYRTVIIEPVEATLADQTMVRVSSSMIRWLLSHGRARDAAELLGRPYELRGAVGPGDRRGRTIGMPTANLVQSDQLLPADGIYAGLAARPDGARFAAAISVGTKPTFGPHPRTCEAHLLGYHGPVDDYGWTMCLEFHHWLRDQITFEAIEPLVAQLGRDVQRTAALMRDVAEVRGQKPAVSMLSHR